MNFAHSSHRSRWIFTAAELESTRQTNNLASISSKTTADRNSEGPSTSKPARRSREPLTVEEEKHLLRYYMARISHICQALHLPRRVQAAAQMYLKRFYLLNSCMDHDPQPIALVCIYIACKIEENYISAEELCRQLQLDPQVVLGTELRLLCGLKFDFIVHNPYRALAGCFVDIETLQTEDPSQLDEGLARCSSSVMDKARGEAGGAADALMRMDCPLLFPPGQMAAQCLRVGFGKCKIGVERYLRRLARMGALSAGKEEGAEAAYQQLLAACEAIDQVGRADGQTLDQKEVAAVDRKLKLWISSQSEAAGKADTVSKDERDRRRQAKVARRRGEQQAAQEALLGPMPDLKRATT